MQGKWTSLHLAAGRSRISRGHRESLQLLLAANGNPNAKLEGGGTPLHMAAELDQGSSEAMQLLLVAKGNVNAEGYVSASPFASMMELYGAELSVGSCRGREHRCTTLLSMVTVSQCSTCSLPRPISMLRTMCVPLSL